MSLASLFWGGNRKKKSGDGSGQIDKFKPMLKKMKVVG